MTLLFTLVLVALLVRGPLRRIAAAIEAQNKAYGIGAPPAPEQDDGGPEAAG